MNFNSERGFTLIELLTITGIIGILAYLGITSFYLYKSSAGYAAATKTVIDARTVLEGTLNKDPDNLPVAVPITVVTAEGPIADVNAYALLPQVRLGKRMKLTVSYDPDCADSGCQSEYIEASHCQSIDHMAWVRFGDGVGAVIDHAPGGGC